eukprot:4638378-Amphidinium_carterae.1
MDKGKNFWEGRASESAGDGASMLPASQLRAESCASENKKQLKHKRVGLPAAPSRGMPNYSPHQAWRRQTHPSH